ncbi:hypothetical protein PCE1_004045 [Barthelona sp. PCE]
MFAGHFALAVYVTSFPQVLIPLWTNIVGCILPDILIGFLGGYKDFALSHGVVEIILWGLVYAGIMAACNIRGARTRFGFLTVWSVVFSHLILDIISLPFKNPGIGIPFIKTGDMSLGFGLEYTQLGFALTELFCLGLLAYSIILYRKRLPEKRKAIAIFKGETTSFKNVPETIKDTSNEDTVNAYV